MKVKELIKILEDCDIQINIKFATDSYNEEIHDIDVWTIEFFEKEI